MAKYRICLMMDGKWKYEEVDGEPIVIDGFEEVEFFLHHPYKYEKTDIVMISERSTGYGITSWALSKEEAVKQATASLNEVGIDALRERIKHLLEIASKGGEGGQKK